MQQIKARVANFMIDLGKSLIQIAVADVLFQQHNEEWQMKQNYKPSQKHKVRIISTIFHFGRFAF